MSESKLDDGRWHNIEMYVKNDAQTIWIDGKQWRKEEAR